MRQVEEATVTLSPAGRVGDTAQEIAADPVFVKSKLEIADPVK